MSDLPTHTQRWATHRQPLRPDPMESVAASDREESRAAAAYDNTWYVRIGGEWVDAERIPPLSDILEEDW